MAKIPDYPVRKIAISSRSITGTMPEGDRYESALERDLMIILRFDNNVKNIVAQPVTIEYISHEGKVLGYTPDIFIEYRTDIYPARNMRNILGEVKYKDELCKNFREFRPKFKAAMRYAKENGWAFKIFTEDTIRTPFLFNALFLKDYLDKFPTPEADTKRLILNILEDLRVTTVQTLLAAIYRDKWNQAALLPSIWHLIATREVGCDLTIRINMETPIWTLKD